MTRSLSGSLLVCALAGLVGCASPGGGAGTSDLSGSDAGPTSLCRTGDTRSCFCLAGGQGNQVCRDDGMSFGSCTGCVNDGGGFSVSDMRAGSPCGDCDGCCNGTTCVTFANQSNSQCGVAGTVCGACSSGTLCDGASGMCVQSTGGSCSSCSNGCCGTAADHTATCFVNNSAQCGTGGGSCTACTQGTLCSTGMCNDKLDPMYSFRVTVSKSQFYNNDGNGGCWDNYATFGCAQPDVHVCFGYDAGSGLVHGCTTLIDDVPIDNGKDGKDAAATDTATWSASDGLIKDDSGQVFYIPGSYFINGKALMYVEDTDSTSSADLIGSTYLSAGTYFTGYVNTKPFGRVLTVNFTLK